MSKIAEQIAKLKEKEKQLERETRKVEFLTHILESSSKYEHAAFKDVKVEVVDLLSNFVKKTIEAIEAGTVVTISVGPIESAAPVVLNVTAPVAAPVQPGAAVPNKLNTPAGELSPAQKLNFAMDNRHLAGKKVSIMNDKNVDISGSVVGLDAPFVIVKTDTGPTIKVPLERVSLT